MTEQRAYQTTHPWIRFEFDLSGLPFSTWLLLGRVQAKCRFIALAPFLPEVGDKLRRIYLAKGSHATTAIEGNTLSEEQVRQYIGGERRLPPSQAYLGQEVDNVGLLVNQVAGEILAGEKHPISIDRLCHYNAVILRDLPRREEDGIPGEIRQQQVTVGRYLGTPPQDCEYLLGRLCDWLNQPQTVPVGYKVAFGILQAMIAHLYFAWIHPFGDGNGRTARLLEYELLLRAGIPDIAAHLLSNHYNRTREEYYRQLDVASRSGGDMRGFITYALQGLVDGLNEQLDLIQTEQLKVHWRSYIHQVFDDRAGFTAPCKRHLLLDLSDQAAPVPKAELRRLTPRLVEDYHGKTDKTLGRDLNELEEMGLIIIQEGMVQANLNRLVAFLPRLLLVDWD